MHAASPFHATAQTCTRAVCAAALVAIAVSASPPTATADPASVTATVLKVVDGDTIDIRDDVRGRLRVRVLGIDTPETHKPGYTVGCWGPEASDFAESTLLGQRVALITDLTQDLHDRFGRARSHTWFGEMAGTIRSRRLARARPTRMSTGADLLPVTTRLQRQRKKPKTLFADCGVHRAMATPPQFRGDRHVWVRQRTRSPVSRHFHDKGELKMKRFIIGLAVVVGAIGLAVPASADKTDGEFLITLSNGGVPYGDATDAISWAHTVCEFMDEGKSMSRATMAFMQAKGWSIDDAGYFVGAAANLYCPWHVPADMHR